MREILFRGQTRRYGEKVRMNGEKVTSNWVYGGICQGKGDFSIIYGSMDVEREKPIEKRIVYTDTVGQYTGLTDKNGTKIFEGDIIKVDYIGVNKGVSGVAEVVFNDCKFALVWGWHKEIVCLTDFANVCFEIIGNIHDNPELLESEVQGE